MILGIGIDTVSIIRFTDWHTYTKNSLNRLFSPDEIDYCLLDVNFSAQRFAVRFAAREALCKALHSSFFKKSFPLLKVCRHSAIIKTTFNVPYLMVNYQALGIINSNIKTHLSLTHTQDTASAYVILEQI